jgi:hypothetical protein
VDFCCFQLLVFLIGKRKYHVLICDVADDKLMFLLVTYFIFTFFTPLLLVSLVFLILYLGVVEWVFYLQAQLPTQHLTLLLLPLLAKPQWVGSRVREATRG